MRSAAFRHVQRLQEVHDALTSEHLAEGFIYQGTRLPLVNPQRGIFKPKEMRFLLSIRTVYPRKHAKVWYDDQRDVHRQIFEGVDVVDYAFMGKDPDAADNRWLREAFEERVPVIYFLGISPGRYQAIVPAFVAGWDRRALKAQIAMGLPGESELSQDATERRYRDFLLN
jgi:putative restriction endonuclease